MWVVVLVGAIIYVLVMGVFVIYAFHKGWSPWIRDRRRPVERVPADVAQKEEHREFLPMFQHEEVTARLIAFRCQDGQTRVFEVDQRLFDRVSEEEHGMLLYRGDTFVGFEQAHAPSDSDEVYRRLVR